MFVLRIQCFFWASDEDGCAKALATMHCMDIKKGERCSKFCDDTLMEFIPETVNTHSL